MLAYLQYIIIKLNTLTTIDALLHRKAKLSKQGNLLRGSINLIVIT